MKYFILIILLISLVTSLIRKTRSRIPDQWQPGMTLRYENSHGMSGTFSKYHFIRDSVHVHTRSMSEGAHKEEKYTKFITQSLLDGLLKMLRESRVDKMTMRKTGVTLFDGTAYGLQLSVNDQLVINLSNSAYEELDKKDEARFWRVVKHMETLSAK